MDYLQPFEKIGETAATSKKLESCKAEFLTDIRHLRIGKIRFDSGFSL